MVRGAVSLAIAAVPEGLPTVATVCLANGMRSLLQDRVLARRLAAIEALGSIGVLCFDKTGTLTWNRMSAVSVHVGMRRYAVSGAAFLRGSRAVSPDKHAELAKLLEVCSLCSEATVEMRSGEWAVTGTPTESALAHMALGAGVDVPALRNRLPLVSVEQRTEGQPYMTTSHRLSDERYLIALKGSPVEVIGLCGWYAQQGKVLELGDSEREENLSGKCPEMAEMGCAFWAPPASRLMRFGPRGASSGWA